jgi:hypothetical protein
MAAEANPAAGALSANATSCWTGRWTTFSSHTPNLIAPVLPWLNRPRPSSIGCHNQAEYKAASAPQAGVVAKRQAEAGQVVAAAGNHHLVTDGEREAGSVQWSSAVRLLCRGKPVA